MGAAKGIPRKNIQIILYAIVLLVYIFLSKTNPGLFTSSSSPTPTPTTAQESTPAATFARVKRAIDGDTIKLDTGETVRYIGIDTPETVSPNKTVQCYGQEASAKNKVLVEGKVVRLESDVSNKDRYGRLLRYVWVEDMFINDILVREGYAHASTFPPDVQFQTQFKDAQTYAREHKLGLWGPVCTTPTPQP